LRSVRLGKAIDVGLEISCGACCRAHQTFTTTVNVPVMLEPVAPDGVMLGLKLP
jgi:hypothetical protein